MSWRSVGKSFQALSAHLLLLCFTVLLVVKLDHYSDFSWWVVFSPVWVFHAVVARGRFSLPAPSIPYDRHWAPCHAVVATPLLVAFELLLCIYLESIYVYHSAAVNLKFVFLPLLAFEITILVDNFRFQRSGLVGFVCKFWVTPVCDALSHPPDWWLQLELTKINICFGSVAECFAFLVCTKWSNPAIHRSSDALGASSSSATIRRLNWNSGLVVSSEEEPQSRICGLQDLGGHIMKIPIILFQVLLCMRLEGTPAAAKHISLPVIFLPIFLLQGAGILFATLRFVEKTVLLLRSGAAVGQYHVISSRVRDCFAFMHHGSRYSTFCGYPPEIVKKLPKKDLAEEVWRLQAALGEQAEITKLSQQEYERLQNEKVLCRICFEREISTVLLPCRHRVLCSSCCEKCDNCPICRVCINERLPVYDV